MANVWPLSSQPSMNANTSIAPLSGQYLLTVAKQNASLLVWPMLIAQAGRQMDAGWPLSLSVRVSLPTRMKRSRKSRAKANPRYGSSRPIEVRHINSPLCSMVPLILSGHPLVNGWYLRRRSARQMKKPKMANHCLKCVLSIDFGTDSMVLALSMKEGTASFLSILQAVNRNNSPKEIGMMLIQPGLLMGHALPLSLAAPRTAGAYPVPMSIR